MIADVLRLTCAPSRCIGKRPYRIAATALAGATMLLIVVPVAGSALSLLTMWPWSCLLIKRFNDARRSILPILTILLLCGGSGIFNIVLAAAATSPDHVGLAFLLSQWAFQFHMSCTLAALTLVAVSAFLDSKHSFELENEDLALHLVPFEDETAHGAGRQG